MDDKQNQLKNDVPRWAEVEIMMRYERVCYGGLISKDNTFGIAMVRIDIPQSKDGATFFTQLINPSSVFRITFCTEGDARHLTKIARELDWIK
ncbi:MAG: hypothetical protein LBC18_08795 [Opitutaceae bacterium]|jgi:hypothetical protein|nr:hypothetical protein [Opitutaceae bacterium]